jgi:hypothetical protein
MKDCAYCGESHSDYWPWIKVMYDKFATFWFCRERCYDEWLKERDDQ